METWGGTVVPSPSSETNAGRAILEQDPESPGSLGIAISEALEYAVTHDGFKYSLGSVVNFVILHQTVIGLEARKQMEMAGDYPDIIIGCAGGGSNASGLIYPFLKEVARFYVSFMSRCAQDANGKILLGPSFSPEHPPMGIFN